MLNHYVFWEKKNTDLIHGAITAVPTEPFGTSWLTVVLGKEVKNKPLALP